MIENNTSDDQQIDNCQVSLLFEWKKKLRSWK